MCLSRPFLTVHLIETESKTSFNQLFLGILQLHHIAIQKAKVQQSNEQLSTAVRNRPNFSRPQHTDIWPSKNKEPKVQTILYHF